MPIDPHAVNSPQDRLKDLEVLYIDNEIGYSVARMVWDGNPSFGIRWNGDEEHSMGNPQSSGHPTWFILPSEVAETFLHIKKLM